MNLMSQQYITSLFNEWMIKIRYKNGGLESEFKNYITIDTLTNEKHIIDFYKDSNGIDSDFFQVLYINEIYITSMNNDYRSYMNLLYLYVIE